MKKLTALLFATLLLSLTGIAAQASTIYSTTLAASNEVPPTSSGGSGSATVTLMDDMTTLLVAVNFMGLTGPAAMGHIHCCIAPGGNAPVALPFVSFPAATAGTYSHTFDLSASGTLINGVTAAALIAGLQSGSAYVNIHTAQYPAGEIRGFLVATPEPATWSFLALALGAGLSTRFLRRRKQTA